MIAPITLHVALGDRSYPIVIGSKLLGDTAVMKLHLSSSRVALVTNETLMPMYGESLSRVFANAGITVVPVVLPDGEIYKDWPALNRIFDTLLANQCDRKTTIVALGGGVIGDIAGFAAATYQRGVPFIQIPTTLLAQVDSSVGGKTAVNHPLGKNMIGAFYQPQLVVADTDTLVSLPERELRSGLAEIIKYGMALDSAFFEWLDLNMELLLKRDSAALAYAIRRSCEIKANVVALDERETTSNGGRALLNFGHTFGHTIESSLGYGTWLHGEAVACGMALASQLSSQLGIFDRTDCERAINLILRAGLTTRIPKTITADEMLDHMGRDKKNEGGAIRLILLQSIGHAVVESTIGSLKIREFLVKSIDEQEIKP